MVTTDVQDESIDVELLARLLRNLQPGLVQAVPTRRILAWLEYFASRLGLVGELARRRGISPLKTQDLAIVYARPIRELATETTHERERESSMIQRAGVTVAVSTVEVRPSERVLTRDLRVEHEQAPKGAVHSANLSHSESVHEIWTQMSQLEVAHEMRAPLPQLEVADEARATVSRLEVGHVEASESFPVAVQRVAQELGPGIPVVSAGPVGGREVPVTNAHTSELPMVLPRLPRDEQSAQELGPGIPVVTGPVGGREVPVTHAHTSELPMVLPRLPRGEQILMQGEARDVAVVVPTMSTDFGLTREHTDNRESPMALAHGVRSQVQARTPESAKEGAQTACGELQGRRSAPRTPEAMVELRPTIVIGRPVLVDEEAHAVRHTPIAVVAARSDPALSEGMLSVGSGARSAKSVVVPPRPGVVPLQTELPIVRASGGGAARTPEATASSPAAARPATPQAVPEVVPVVQTSVRPQRTDEQIDLEGLVERVQRRLIQRVSIERQRQGGF